MQERYWIADSAASFNNTSSWSTSQKGLPGASVPGPLDFVVFNTSPGPCSIDATINIAGLALTPQYSGTITQNSFPIFIGEKGAILEGGTFQGGSSNISILGDLYLKGTDFTNTDATLSVYGSFKRWPNSDFIDNSGSLRIVSSNQHFNPAGISFNKLIFDGTSTHLIDSSCYIEEDLILSGGILRTTVIDSTLYAHKNITCNYGAGAWSPSHNIAVIVDGSGIQSITPNGGILPHITIDKTTTAHVTVNGGGDTLYINGDLLINDGTFNLNNHHLSLQGGILESATQVLPRADFSYASDGTRFITFNDLSLGSPISWSWDFGDGTHSTTQNPTHTYDNTNASYITRLTINSATGSDWAVALIPIDVTGAFINSEFQNMTDLIGPALWQNTTDYTASSYQEIT